MAGRTWQSIRPDFSIVLDGPLYRFYLRTRLALPDLELVRRRILTFVLVCWLPLLLLSLFEGRLMDHAPMPFLRDAEVHTKFLGALPLLIAAEFTVHRRMRIIVAQFLDRGIIGQETVPRFGQLVASAVRLRNSVAVEVFLAVLVVTGGHWLWSRNLALGVSSWYGAKIDGHTHLSAAGYWYAFVSLPVLRFLLLRWYYRLFIWYRFLWSIRKLPLQLKFFHPDRAAGLAFLSSSAIAFAPVLVAQTVMLAGIIGNRIWHAGARLPAFKMDILIVVLFLLVVVLTPLTFFSLQLLLVRRAALREFGALASRYVDEFRQKWVLNPEEPRESLVGTPDLQSLADLGNAYDTVRGTRIVPFSRNTVLRVTFVVLLPLAPLTLTMLPLDQMIDRLVKLAL